MVALIGDNGAGKSTLVKVLSGVIEPDEGQMLLRGEPVTLDSPQHARALGIETVFQDLALAPELGPAENAFIGREILKPGLLGKLGVLDKGEMRRQAFESFTVHGHGRQGPRRAGRRRCPAVSARAWRSAARSCGRTSSSSWTSRPPRSACARPGRCSS